IPEEIRTLDIEVPAASAVLPELDAGEPFRLRGELPTASAHRLVLRFGDGGRDRDLVLAIDSEGHICLDRSSAHEEPFAPEHTHSQPYASARAGGTVAFDLVVDRSCVDLELDGGRALISQQIFPGARTVTVLTE